MRIIVVGGGISGLTAAYLAMQAGHDVLCIEAGQPGGLIQTEHHDGYLCEVGPQAVLDNAPDTMALLDALGLAERALHANPAAQRRFIFKGGKLHLVPSGPSGLLRSRLLSWPAKLRLLAEPLVRPRTVPDDDETVLAFGARRLGREAAQVLLATFIIGVFAGAADELALAAALPRLAALERAHGSLFRAMLAARKMGAKRGHPLSFPDGLAELPRALAAALGVRLASGRVTSIEPGASGGWHLEVDGTTARREEAEAVVVATDAVSAARLLGHLVPTVRLLAQVPAAPIAVCALGFRDDAQSPPLHTRLDGYGFLVARGEAPRLLGCQYESSTFAGRAPEGAALVRCILGGSGAGFDPGIVDQSDTEITRRALGDLKQITGLTGEPHFARVWRHPNGIPQFRPGHLRLVAAIDGELAARPRLHLLGHTLRGVGVNESVRAAASVVRTLTSSS